MLSSLKKQFDNDEAFLLNHTKEFLTISGVGVPLETNRAKIEEAVEKGSFTEALQVLAILRHEKTSIKLTKIEGKNGETSILIRDGHNNPNEKIVLGTEAFEMQYLNAIRGAIDRANTENKPELVLKLNKAAVKFINHFHALNMEKSHHLFFREEAMNVCIKNATDRKKALDAIKLELSDKLFVDCFQKVFPNLNFVKVMVKLEPKP
ncbi:hypothetical protein [Candidatus Rickettsia kedanie]|uniref:Uncharacterized protein n=1 Tax=Candidatus Rickettsia kedanie TaxID=3115352 RepID=A0ABP9TSD9_9RICK